MAEDDLDAVVRFLSNALDLARERRYSAKEPRLEGDESCDPSYWLG
jgi:hypothetical protein